MDLSNEKTFEHLFQFCFFLSLVYIGIVFFVLKRKGVETNSTKVIMWVALTAALIVCVPFWLKSDLSLQFKIVVPLVSAIFTSIYGLGVIKIRKVIHNKSDKEQ
jgi:hypothetical protein